MASQTVKVAKKAGPTINPLDVVETMVACADRWVTEVQGSASHRAGIASWENVQTEKIHAPKAVHLEALDLVLDERRENFRRLFDNLDSSMESGDAAQTAAILTSITKLARERPFKELANLEIVVSDLKRPDQVWDV